MGRVIDECINGGGGGGGLVLGGRTDGDTDPRTCLCEMAETKKKTNKKKTDLISQFSLMRV